MEAIALLEHLPVARVEGGEIQGTVWRRRRHHQLESYSLQFRGKRNGEADWTNFSSNREGPTKSAAFQGLRSSRIAPTRRSGCRTFITWSPPFTRMTRA